MVPSSAQKRVASKTRKFFQSILSSKPWKIDAHRDLNVQVMAAGEKICFGYAFVFAVREALKLDVPVVLDSPYAILDDCLRKGLRDFLANQPCQQVLLGQFVVAVVPSAPDHVYARSVAFLVDIEDVPDHGRAAPSAISATYSHRVW